MLATQLNPRSFANKLGMCGGHFAIKQEGHVGIKFFLDLIQPLVRPVPRPTFVHHEHDFIGAPVVREKIDHIDAMFGL